MVESVVEFYRSSVGHTVEVDHEGLKPATLKGVTAEAIVAVRVDGSEYTMTVPLDRVKLLPRGERAERVMDRAQSA